MEAARGLELSQPYLVPFFFEKVFFTLRWRLLSSKVANPPLSRVTDSSMLEMLLPKAGRGNEHRCFSKLLPDGLLDGAQGRAGLRQPTRQAGSGCGERLHVNPAAKCRLHFGVYSARHQTPSTLISILLKSSQNT